MKKETPIKIEHYFILLVVIIIVFLLFVYVFKNLEEAENSNISDPYVLENDQVSNYKEVSENFSFFDTANSSKANDAFSITEINGGISENITHALILDASNNPLTVEVLEFGTYHRIDNYVYIICNDGNTYITHGENVIFYSKKD